MVEGAVTFWAVQPRGIISAKRRAASLHAE
jgi:hypothetical protein